MQDFKVVYEEFKVRGRELVDKVGELIREGNVRRIIVKDEKGNTFVEILPPLIPRWNSLTVGFFGIFRLVPEFYNFGGRIEPIIVHWGKLQFILIDLVLERELKTDVLSRLGAKGKPFRRRPPL